jgi:hypothetical protein
MEVKVANFKGVQKATLNASPIAILLGPNKAGKTSICQAAALALIGEAMPELGIAKSSAGALVHGGAEKGIAQVKSEDGKSVVKWPAADVETEGKPPMSSAFAAGVCDKNNVWTLFAMKQKERATCLAEILDVLPDLEKDLRPAMEKVGYTEKNCDNIIEAITENNWDPIHKKMKDHGAKMKGQWEEVTNDRYGSSKGEGWIPEDWEDDLADASLQTLEGERDKARTSLEEIIAVDAVDQATVDDLTGKAGALDAALKSYKEYEESYIAAEKTLAEAQASMDGTPAPVSLANPIVLTCPFCNQNSHLERDGVDYSLVEPSDEGPSEEEQAEVAETYDAVKLLVKTAAEALNTARVSMGRAEQEVDNAEKAKAELEKLGEVSDGPDDSVVEAARQTVADCQASIDKFNAYTRSRTIHASIVRNQKIVKLLEPQGLRQKKLTDALGEFHKKLSALCKTAGWSDVTLDEDDLELCYGPRRFALMSESEKFRTRCIMQIALAQVDGSYAIVIDGADILDLPARKELFKLLMKTKVTAIVSMTLGEQSEIPGWIGKAFNGTNGAAYWVEGATTSEPLFAG